MWKNLSKNGIIHPMPRKIEISHKTIIFTVLFLLGLWFLYFVRNIVIQIFVAFLLATILEPFVVLLGKIKIPRAISILITYILVIGIIGGVIALFAPALVTQTTNFANALPLYLTNIGINSSTSGDVVKELLSQIGGVSGQILNFTFSIFSNVISVITVLVFTFYMLLVSNKFKSQIELSLGEEKGKNVSRILSLIEERLGKWSRGEFILMLAVGIGMYLGLLAIGIPYALPLAVLAGILEIVPTLGPIVAAIPAVLIGLGISPLAGIGAAVVAFLVQQLENYILVPKIMQKSAGVSPLIVLISIAIGAKLLGVTGVIIAVPTVIILQVLIKEYFIKE